VNIAAAVEHALAVTPILDIHTHLFSHSFGGLALSGIDEILTYHYLEAEVFRFCSVTPANYRILNKQERANLIWQTLFVENTPISEATRGVVSILQALGLDPSTPTLQPLRDFFRDQNPDNHLTRVLQLAGVDSVVMTNDPLDPLETARWDSGVEPDPRFHAALRLDRLVNEFPERHTAVDASALANQRRFLDAWCTRMNPLYMAISLPDTFQFPADDARTRLLAEVVIPTCGERRLPLALMIGVRRQVNPALGLAGDALGRADLRCLESLCLRFPEQRFLVSVLSRENQHELCVYARKFRDLMPFGCWWFLNNPSIVEEITRERIEMLGLSFIPQNSDARILEQLIYKWRNTRRTLAPILTNSYELLAADGREVTPADIQRDVNRLFRTNFQHWTGLAD
jgi:hypothetical protein